MAAASVNCPATRSRSRAASSPGFRASHWVFKRGRDGRRVDRLEIDGGEVGGLAIQGGRQPSPRAVCGSRRGRCRATRRGRHRRAPGPAGASRAGGRWTWPRAVRVVGVVADGLTRLMAEEQMQGGLLGEDGDLDGWKRPSSRWRVVKRMRQARVKDCLRGRPGGRAGRDRRGYRRRARRRAPVELLEGGPELMIGRLVERLGPKPGTDLGESLGERFGGVDPEDAAGVVVLMAVDVFDGELGLADAAHAGQPGRPDADRLSRLEDGVQPVEVVGATDEVGVPGERHEEWNLARRGYRPSRQRARRKFSRALRIVSRPGPVVLSAQRNSSAACSRTVPWRAICPAAPSISVTNIGHVAGGEPGDGSHQGRPVDRPGWFGSRRRRMGEGGPDSEDAERRSRGSWPPHGCRGRCP